MSKRLFLSVVFLTLTLTLTQFATADYTLANGSATERAWVTYSVWQPADQNWPAGWRTTGWYEVKPGAMRTLRVPAENPMVYIRVKRGGEEVRPPDHATKDRYPFWIHPTAAFTAVETHEGDFLKSDHDRWLLKQAAFYKYQNGGQHTIVEEPRLANRPAQQIHDEAIHSVVWIRTDEGHGSGVLIDKHKKLIVTNQHVTGTAAEVTVVFPYRHNSGELEKDRDVYLADNNRQVLMSNGYITRGKVIAQNVENDLAIVQLAQLPPTATEIKHDFSRDVEDSMRQGDTVHILGNPGDRLWNWTQGTFRTPQQMCLLAGGACLVMEGDAEGGNSGGPVLNGQGTFIGILTEGTDETMAAAAPAKNVKALLRTVPADLPPVPPLQIHPKQVFKIRNHTGVTVPYQIKWSENDAWESQSLETGYIATYTSSGQNIPSGYPKIRFDHIAGDGQRVTYRSYNLESALESATVAPVYWFGFTGNQLDLYRDGFAAPALSTVPPNETVLLSNYPNPSNPETWIPYKLSKPAAVTVSIYSADGQLVRTLALGHQPAGLYQSKSRAAYWDGRNALGERVASGVYFYTLKAGDFTATRKMLIRK